MVEPYSRIHLTRPLNNQSFWEQRAPLEERANPEEGLGISFQGLSSKSLHCEAMVALGHVFSGWLYNSLSRGCYDYTLWW